MGHFPNSTLGDVAWNFLKHFSRDPKTGVIYVDGCPATKTEEIGDYDHDRYKHDFGSHEFGYNSAWKGHGKC